MASPPPAEASVRPGPRAKGWSRRGWETAPTFFLDISPAGLLRLNIIEKEIHSCGLHGSK